MAFSTSVKNSQDVIVCQLCETVTKIKVKCLDCNLLMCEQCKNKTHLKFKNAESHTVVPLRDISLCGESESAKFKQVKCSDHPPKACCMYCEKCEKLVCPKCISSCHQKHDLADIETLCQDKIKNLRGLQGRADAKKACLSKLKKIEKSKYLTIKQQILDEERRVVDEIRLTYADRLDKLENADKCVSKLISAKEEIISKEKNIIDKEFDEFDDYVKAGYPDKILKRSHILEDHLKKLSGIESVSGLYTWKSLRYVPGKGLARTEPDVDLWETQLKLVDTYETEFINSMSIDTRGSLWMKSGVNIYRLDSPYKHNITKQFSFSGRLEEIKCLNVDTILILTGCEIKKLRLSDKTISVFKDLSPNIPTTLHISKSRNIFVGMNIGKYKDQKNKLVIVKLTPEGKTICEYLNSELLLINEFVRSCTVVKDDSLCFIDSCDVVEVSSTDRIVRFKENGKIQWVYSGNPETNTNEMPFRPIEVLCTESDNIVVSDKFTSILHILDKSGSVILLLNLNFLEIDRVGVMVLADKESVLWLHNNRKLRCISFTGF